MDLKRAKTKKKNSKQAVQQIEDENVRMNVNIPKSFYKQIKQRALDEDATITEVVVKALREYLNK